MGAHLKRSAWGHEHSANDTDGKGSGGHDLMLRFSGGARCNRLLCAVCGRGHISRQALSPGKITTSSTVATSSAVESYRCTSSIERNCLKWSNMPGQVTGTMQKRLRELRDRDLATAHALQVINVKFYCVIDSLLYSASLFRAVITSDIARCDKPTASRL
jgi:hypothetical protein